MSCAQLLCNQSWTEFIGALARETFFMSLADFYVNLWEPHVLYKDVNGRVVSVSSFDHFSLPSDFATMT